MSNINENIEKIGTEVPQEKKQIPTKLFALPLPADKEMSSEEMLETLAGKFKVTKQ